MNLQQHLKSIAINVATIALAIAIGMPIGIFLMKQFKPGATPPAPITLGTNTANLVFKDVSAEFVLFATTTCNFCAEGVQLLDKSGVRYKVYYIDKDTQAEKIYASMKINGVPTLFSKNQYINGFSEKSWTNFICKENTQLSVLAPQKP